MVSATRRRDVDRDDDRAQNPYTALEGYELVDASGAEVGTVEDTVYDAETDVLKYISVSGHAIPADRIRVDAEDERVRAPYDKSTIESAPALEETSGKFDRALRDHYGEDQ